MARSYAVAGGGMAGMFYAAELKRIDPDSEVHLVESAPTLGGTYNSIRYPGDRIFDYGMHLFYEACDERVDRVVREVLPDDEWHFWTGNRKDIAGLYWRGRLQTGSHYVDLRREPDRRGALGDLFEKVGDAGWKSAADCETYFREKFGDALAENVFAPIQRKLWNAEPRAMDPFAVRMVSADRVVLYDHEAMLDLMKSEALRARLGVPDQMRLPPGVRASPQRALYPRKYGLSHYIERFTRKLESAGVKLHLGAQIKQLGSSGSKVTLATSTGAIEADHVFWAAPLMQLPALLGIAIDDLKMDIPHHIGYAHFVLDRAPAMGELYYFYCYDAPMHAFRVTNYAAYCPESAAGGHAVCVEMQYLGNEKPPEKAAVVEGAKAELAAMGVVTDQRVTFADAYVSRFGFPRPTIANREAFGRIRARVAERLPGGITIGGIAPDLGRFFLQDVLTAAADQLETLAA